MSSTSSSSYSYEEIVVGNGRNQTSSQRPNRSSNVGPSSSIRKTQPRTGNNRLKQLASLFLSKDNAPTPNRTAVQRMKDAIIETASAATRKLPVLGLGRSDDKDNADISNSQQTNASTPVQENLADSGAPAVPVEKNDSNKRVAQPDQVDIQSASVGDEVSNDNATTVQVPVDEIQPGIVNVGVNGHQERPPPEGMKTHEVLTEGAKEPTAQDIMRKHNEWPENVPKPKFMLREFAHNPIRKTGSSPARPSNSQPSPQLFTGSSGLPTPVGGEQDLVLRGMRNRQQSMDAWRNRRDQEGLWPKATNPLPPPGPSSSNSKFQHRPYDANAMSKGGRPKSILKQPRFSLNYTPNFSTVPNSTNRRDNIAGSGNYSMSSTEQLSNDQVNKDGAHQVDDRAGRAKRLSNRASFRIPPHQRLHRPVSMPAPGIVTKSCPLVDLRDHVKSLADPGKRTPANPNYPALDPPRSSTPPPFEKSVLDNLRKMAERDREEREKELNRRKRVGIPVIPPNSSIKRRRALGQFIPAPLSFEPYKPKPRATNAVISYRAYLAEKDKEEAEKDKSEEATETDDKENDNQVSKPSKSTPGVATQMKKPSNRTKSGKSALHSALERDVAAGTFPFQLSPEALQRIADRRAKRKADLEAMWAAPKKLFVTPGEEESTPSAKKLDGTDGASAVQPKTSAINGSQAAPDADDDDSCEIQPVLKSRDSKKDKRSAEGKGAKLGGFSLRPAHFQPIETIANGTSSKGSQRSRSEKKALADAEAKLRAAEEKLAQVEAVREEAKRIKAEAEATLANAELLRKSAAAEKKDTTAPSSATFEDPVSEPVKNCVVQDDKQTKDTESPEAEDLSRLEQATRKIKAPSFGESVYNPPSSFAANSGSGPTNPPSFLAQDKVTSKNINPLFAQPSKTAFPSFKPSTEDDEDVNPKPSAGGPNNLAEQFPSINKLPETTFPNVASAQPSEPQSQAAEDTNGGANFKPKPSAMFSFGSAAPKESKQDIPFTQGTFGAVDVKKDNQESKDSAASAFLANETAAKVNTEDESNAAEAAPPADTIPTATAADEDADRIVAGEQDQESDGSPKHLSNGVKEKEEDGERGNEEDANNSSDAAKPVSNFTFGAAVPSTPAVVTPFGQSTNGLSNVPTFGQPPASNEQFSSDPANFSDKIANPFAKSAETEKSDEQKQGEVTGTEDGNDATKPSASAFPFSSTFGSSAPISIFSTNAAPNTEEASGEVEIAEPAKDQTPSVDNQLKPSESRDNDPMTAATPPSVKEAGTVGVNESTMPANPFAMGGAPSSGPSFEAPTGSIFGSAAPVAKAEGGPFADSRFSSNSGPGNFSSFVFGTNPSTQEPAAKVLSNPGFSFGSATNNSALPTTGFQFGSGAANVASGSGSESSAVFGGSAAATPAPTTFGAGVGAPASAAATAVPAPSTGNIGFGASASGTSLFGGTFNVANPFGSSGSGGNTATFGAGLQSSGPSFGDNNTGANAFTAAAAAAASSGNNNRVGNMQPGGFGLDPFAAVTQPQSNASLPSGGAAPAVNPFSFNQAPPQAGGGNAAFSIGSTAVAPRRRVRVRRTLNQR